MELGVNVGRFSPIHLGHEAVINQMVETHTTKQSLIVIGSCNQERSFRHFFPYEDRRTLIKRLYPEVNIVGLPDYRTDEEWLLALDDIIELAGGDPKETTFYGGCEEDVLFFIDAGRKYKILNRFDGSTPKISATEIRDALIHDRSIRDLVNEKIESDLKQMFMRRWDEFRRR